MSETESQSKYMNKGEGLDRPVFNTQSIHNYQTNSPNSNRICTLECVILFASLIVAYFLRSIQDLRNKKW